MASEHDRNDRKFTALYVGVVVDNKDPEKVGRVRIRIPGLIDPASEWAFPLGWPGAGGKKRGWFAPPEINDEVGVFFHQGDIDHPYYMCGHPGRGEQPDEVEQGTVEDALKVKVFETARWRLTFDERTGKHLLQLRDKLTDDVIEIDGAALGIRIKATSAILIEATGAVAIRGGSVTLQGRQVTPNGKAI